MRIPLMPKGVKHILMARTRARFGRCGFLRDATEEAVAHLQWLKRFAEAEGLTAGDNP